jgi:hypothetical protein
VKAVKVVVGIVAVAVVVAVVVVVVVAVAAVEFAFALAQSGAPAKRIHAVDMGLMAVVASVAVVVAHRPLGRRVVFVIQTQAARGAWEAVMVDGCARQARPGLQLQGCRAQREDHIGAGCARRSEWASSASTVNVAEGRDGRTWRLATPV